MADQEIIDAAAAENKRERVAAQDALHDAIIDLIPKGMPTPDVAGVLMNLLVEGIIQVHPRVKKDALEVAKNLGEKLADFVEKEWGSPIHQSYLSGRSREVN